MAGIYIHIPFCRKACHYCNFHFSTTQQRIPEMVDAICKETRLQQNYLTEKIDTVYLGGGTPSLLSQKQLGQVLETIRSVFDIDTNAETSLEANPDDITQETLAYWKQAGINRLSIGIQSFFEEDLQWMNRAHTATQAKDCIALAQQTGIANISIDLIYGTPTLSDAQWLANIDTALEMGIPHLSCYALTVEPKTALSKMIAQKQWEDVDTDKQARHFTMLTKRLLSAGFEHYEISNFAKPGFRSRHNSSYWLGKPYLGLGPSAHSFNGSSRQWNIANNSLYLSALASDTVPFEIETLTPVQQWNEMIMIRLRTLEGISLNEVLEKWGLSRKDWLVAESAKHIADGNLVIKEGILQITPAGKFLADGIASDLFLEEGQ